MSRLLFVSVTANVLLLCAVAAAQTSSFRAVAAQHAEDKEYAITVVMNDDEVVAARSKELGEAVLAFKTLGELIPVHRDTLERLKAKKDTSAVIVGRLSEPGQLSVKSFKWVKP